MTDEKKKPEFDVKLGRLRATVWKNKSSEGKEYRSVNFESSYKDKDGNWKNSSSFSEHELPQLEKLVDLVFHKLRS